MLMDFLLNSTMGFKMFAKKFHRNTMCLVHRWQKNLNDNGAVSKNI